MDRAAFSSAVSGAAAFAPSSAFFAFGPRENAVRSFCTSGTGQTQPQNARANTMMRTTMITSEMTARGTTSFEASIVVSAPSGHRIEISEMPGAESVPMPLVVKNPMVMMRTTARAVRVRNVFDFMAAS